jgi:type 1 glutamine amidotransferase
MKRAFATLCLLAVVHSAASAQDKKKIVFVSGPPSHGWGDHEHHAGSLILAKALNESGLPVETAVAKHGWPKEEGFFDGAATVVVYCDGGGGHLLNKRLEPFGELMKKGVGLVCVHYGVETVKGAPGDAFLNWIGGYFETNWSVNPWWDADFQKLPDHPITRGVKPFKIRDEWYYNMRFRENMEGVTPILTAAPPDDTRKRPDGPHSNNPAVRGKIGQGALEHVAWAYQRPDGGRGFGFTGGHRHFNWGNDDFRKLMLNAIWWTAKGEVPAEGVASKTPSQEELEANLDKPKPEKKK